MNSKKLTQIDRYILAVPKAELHVHLEGSIQPATFLTLAKRISVQLPVEDIEGLQKWFTFRDFTHFREIYFRAEMTKFQQAIMH